MFEMFVGLLVGLVWGWVLNGFHHDHKRNMRINRMLRNQKTPDPGYLLDKDV